MSDCCSSSWMELNDPIEWQTLKHQSDWMLVSIWAHGFHSHQSDLSKGNKFRNIILFRFSLTPSTWIPFQSGSERFRQLWPDLLLPFFQYHPFPVLSYPIRYDSVSIRIGAIPAAVSGSPSSGPRFSGSADSPPFTCPIPTTENSQSKSKSIKLISISELMRPNMPMTHQSISLVKRPWNLWSLWNLWKFNQFNWTNSTQWLTDALIFTVMSATTVYLLVHVKASRLPWQPAKSISNNLCRKRRKNQRINK